MSPGSTSAAWLAVALAACAAPAPPPRPPPPPPGVPAPPWVALRAAERTLCATDVDGRTACAGALPLPRTTLPGELEVSDAGVCARGAGAARCRTRVVDRAFATPFLEVVRGPGHPCARDAGGAVWCFAGSAEEEATAALVPVDLPAPARRLGGDGARLYAWLADGRLVSFRSPAHGGGPPAPVAEGVTAFASDGWTDACWLRGPVLACAVRPVDGGPWPVDRVGVGRSVVCASDARATRCEGLPGSLPGGRDLAVGAAFACVLREGGAVACVGDAPALDAEDGAPPRDPASAPDWAGR